MSQGEQGDKKWLDSNFILRMGQILHASEFDVGIQKSVILDLQHCCWFFVFFFFSEN